MVKKYKNNRKAFSLVEVLTATIVMTMMLVSVIAYIQYGSLVWQKGQTKIAAKNYSRMAFDLIKQDLMKAVNIKNPQASTSVTVGNVLGYYMVISGNKEEFKLGVPDSKMVLQRLIGGGDAAKELIWNTRMARNVSLFQVERISTWTLKISLQIRTDEEAVDILDREIVSSESIVLTAPAAGG
ncbi:MAG TPA: hypothetical protein PLM07_19235 [Candidatus Rifleibacterium sp.]|nr:hypothetical protein [Candidatus Rifleibacterium sp.]HPT48021.1 hypothetical protein [Candidatus Rifleibacterium sp.]